MSGAGGREVVDEHDSESILSFLTWNLHPASCEEKQRGGLRLPAVMEAWKELRFYRSLARTGTVTVGKSSSVVVRVRVASRVPGSASALTTTVT